MEEAAGGHRRYGRMKYWTLFALRMLARIGFIASVVTWWSSYSTSFSAIIPVGSFFCSVGSHPQGLQVFSGPSSIRRTSWAFRVRHVTDRSTEIDERSSAIDEERHNGYLDDYRSAPGVEYYPTAAGGHVLVLKHWLVCLIFLIAAILTSWRMKRPRAVIKGTDA